MKYDTIKDATCYWVDTFDRINTCMLEEWNESRDNYGLTLLTSPPDYGYYPMWGWMWSFHENLDEEWARQNISVMEELGFIVYDSDYGLFFGIDGAGYDFYEYHWIPLYKARGLKWHKEEE